MMVATMATRDTDTPIYPMTCKESKTVMEVLIGAGLSNMEKCVR